MFDFSRVTEHDRELASQYIGSLYREPDLIIAPAGHGEYIFRWWLVPHNKEANVYFHIQTASDPERPLHDHPWDNTSVILAGGYDEITQHVYGTGAKARLSSVEKDGFMGGQHIHSRRPGQTIHRIASTAHRLILPTHIPYSMSLFMTGPKVRDWGFWTDDGWVSYETVTRTENGLSTWKPQRDTNQILFHGDLDATPIGKYEDLI